MGVILLRWAFIASALATAAALVPDVAVSGGFWGLLGASAVFGLVNSVVGPILTLVALPLTVVTFGVASLVANGVLLALTAGLSDALEVGSFVQTVLAALVVTSIAAAAQFMLHGSVAGTAERAGTTSSSEGRPSRHGRDAP